MRAINIFFLLAIALAGCNKKFLDQEPFVSVPIGDAIKTVDEMGAAVNGVYASMRGSAVYGRSIHTYGDLMADNTYISFLNSGRYLNQNSYAATQASTEPTDTWSGLYVIIKNANLVINAEVPESPLTNARRDQFRGEALTARAWAYFDLVRYFAKPYSVDPNADGVPIILEFDQNSKLPRNKVSEVYTQILNDLTEAFNLMTINKGSAYITKYVARALQAKVYLYKGEWQNARDAALDVVTNSGYQVVSAAGFPAYWKNPAPVATTNPQTKGETLFEVSMDAANNIGNTSLPYMYDQAGYGDFLVTNNLYNLYSATDVRRGLIIAGTRNGTAVWINNKFSNVSSVDKDDVKMMRISEVYLILAEAYNRLNDDANAQLYLNQLVAKRDPAFAGYTSTGAALLEDIITERRKELAFEGERLQDLLRLNRTIERGSQYPAAAQTIAVDNPKRIQPIPQAERDANPNISQNAGYQ